MQLMRQKRKSSVKTFCTGVQQYRTKFPSLCWRRSHNICGTSTKRFVRYKLLQYKSNFMFTDLYSPWLWKLRRAEYDVTSYYHGKRAAYRRGYKEPWNELRRKWYHRHHIIQRSLLSSDTEQVDKGNNRKRLFVDTTIKIWRKDDGTF